MFLKAGYPVLRIFGSQRVNMGAVKQCLSWSSVFSIFMAILDLAILACTG